MFNHSQWERSLINNAYTVALGNGVRSYEAICKGSGLVIQNQVRFCFAQQVFTDGN